MKNFIITLVIFACMLFFGVSMSFGQETTKEKSEKIKKNSKETAKNDKKTAKQKAKAAKAAWISMTDTGPSEAQINKRVKVMNKDLEKTFSKVKKSKSKKVDNAKGSKVDSKNVAPIATVTATSGLKPELVNPAKKKAKVVVKKSELQKKSVIMKVVKKSKNVSRANEIIRRKPKSNAKSAEEMIKNLNFVSRESKQKRLSIIPAGKNISFQNAHVNTKGVDALYVLDDVLSLWSVVCSKSAYDRCEQTEKVKAGELLFTVLSADEYSKDVVFGFKEVGPGVVQLEKFEDVIDTKTYYVLFFTRKYPELSRRIKVIVPSTKPLKVRPVPENNVAKVLKEKTNALELVRNTTVAEEIPRERDQEKDSDLGKTPISIKQRNNTNKNICKDGDENCNIDTSNTYATYAYSDWYPPQSRRRVRRKKIYPNQYQKARYQSKQLVYKRPWQRRSKSVFDDVSTIGRSSTSMTPETEIAALQSTKNALKSKTVGVASEDTPTAQAILVKNNDDTKFFWDWEAPILVLLVLVAIFWCYYSIRESFKSVFIYASFPLIVFILLGLIALIAYSQITLFMFICGGIGVLVSLLFSIRGVTFVYTEKLHRRGKSAGWVSQLDRNLEDSFNAPFVLVKNLFGLVRGKARKRRRKPRQNGKRRKRFRIPNNGIKSP